MQLAPLVMILPFQSLGMHNRCNQVWPFSAFDSCKCWRKPMVHLARTCSSAFPSEVALVRQHLQSGRTDEKAAEAPTANSFFHTSFFSELFLELGISERAEGFYSTDKAGSTHQHGSTFKMIPVVLEVRDQEYLNSSNKTKMPSLDLPMEATRHHVLSSLICLVCYSLLHNLSVLRPL